MIEIVKCGRPGNPLVPRIASHFGVSAATARRWLRHVGPGDNTPLAVKARLLEFLAEETP